MGSARCIRSTNAPICPPGLVMAEDPTTRRTAVRAQHAAQQGCSPGYRQQQIAPRAGRREVLLAPHQRLPRCPTVRLAWPGVCGAWLVRCVRVTGACRGEVVPLASHSLAFMTELVEAQHWRCPWCGDYLPDSPRGTAIDHIIPRVYGGPHRRWNLQLLHQGCNSAKGKKITAGALELAYAHGVTISMDIGQYRASVRRRAVTYAVRATRGLGGEARDRALAESDIAT